MKFALKYGLFGTFKSTIFFNFSLAKGQEKA